MPSDSLSIGLFTLQGDQSRIPQPLPESKPAVRLLQGEGVGACQTDLSCSGPAQQPPLAVGEDAHANPALRRRLSQVVVQLLDVQRGLGSPPDAVPMRRLNSMKVSRAVEVVNGAARGTRGRVLLDHPLAPGETSDDEEIPHHASDVGLGFAIVVSPQYLGGGVAMFGIVYVDVDCQSRPQCASVLGWRIVELPGSPAGMERAHSMTREGSSLSIPSRRSKSVSAEMMRLAPSRCITAVWTRSRALTSGWRSANSAEPRKGYCTGSACPERSPKDGEVSSRQPVAPPCQTPSHSRVHL